MVMLPSAALAAPVSGATFTTEAACDGTNVNIFPSKDAVYLDGGPAHEGAAGLPNGNYYVQVTEPSGTVLGKTTTASVSVVGGEFVVCYQLSAILSNGQQRLHGRGLRHDLEPGRRVQRLGQPGSDLPGIRLEDR
jgi:hypothetical protein